MNFGAALMRSVSTTLGFHSPAKKQPSVLTTKELMGLQKQPELPNTQLAQLHPNLFDQKVKSLKQRKEDKKRDQLGSPKSLASMYIEEGEPFFDGSVDLVNRISQRRGPFRQLIEQILQKVNELEHTIYEDQQNDFKLRLVLERQMERIQNLNFSLDAEKQRNGRLHHLLQNAEPTSPNESDAEDQLLGPPPPDVLDSISPLLMQQRYYELSTSHKRSRRHLLKQNKEIRRLQCDKEALQAKYDLLFEEFKNEQARSEEICHCALRVHIRKKQEILFLKHTLTIGMECVQLSQQALAELQECVDPSYLTAYNSKLESFYDALHWCYKMTNPRQPISSTAAQPEIAASTALAKVSEDSETDATYKLSQASQAKTICDVAREPSMTNRATPSIGNCSGLSIGNFSGLTMCSRSVS